MISEVPQHCFHQRSERTTVPRSLISLCSACGFYVTVWPAVCHTHLHLGRTHPLEQGVSGLRTPPPARWLSQLLALVLGGATSQLKFLKHLPDALPQDSSMTMKCHPVHAGSSQPPLLCGTNLRINLHGSLEGPQGRWASVIHRDTQSDISPFPGCPTFPVSLSPSLTPPTPRSRFQALLSGEPK